MVMQVQKVVKCHFSCSAQVTSFGDGGGVVSGARTEVINEDMLEVEDDEADKAEGGVEAAAAANGRLMPWTAEKTRKR